MGDLDFSAYYGREQSLLKHQILDKYLERFSRIVGKGFPRILYVDGFSGPWNVSSQDLGDSSFAIALQQLRSARDTVREIHHKELELECIFCEKDPIAFQHLERFAKAQSDVRIRTINTSFEDSIDQIVTIANSLGRGCFSFVFIDPTGWKGFSMNLIAPLLRLQPCEVLVNFMTGFILRFVQDERAGLEESFASLFGDRQWKSAIGKLSGRDREDAIVFHYADRIREIGGFSHVPVTVIPHPTSDRSHFHLIYATRRIEGLEVFKDAEKHAVQLAGTVRSDARRRKRESSSGQVELFGGNQMPESQYLEQLRQHYGQMARHEIHKLIDLRKRVEYDEVYATGMRFPLVQVQELREWIAEVATIEGLRDRERVAKLNQGHWVQAL